MSKIAASGSLLALFVSLSMGCTQSQPNPSSVAKTTSSPDAAYLLNEKPENAIGVAAARKGENGEQQIVVEGRIGGSQKPFVDGIAAFTIVDPSIPYCGQDSDETCPTPWDYCCKTDALKDNSALVTIVDAKGAPMSKDARELLGVKELSRVVVQGKLQRDKEGNLTVLAEKVYIAKD